MVAGIVPQLLESLVAGVPAFLFSLRREDLSLLWISEGAGSLTGFESRDLIARPGLFAERVLPEDRDGFSRLCRAGDGRSVVRGEFRFLTAGGKVRWLLASVAPSGEMPGTPDAVTGLAWSIDETKESRREALLGRESLLAAGAPLFLADLGGKIRVWNTAAERLFGWSAEEMGESGIGRLFPFPPEALEKFLRKVQEEGTVTREDRLAAKGGKVVPCRLTVSLVRGEGGIPEGLVAAVGGTAEIRGLESRVQKAITRLGIIQNINRIIASEWDIRKVFHRIVGELPRLVDFDLSSIALFEEGKDPVLIRSRGKGGQENGVGKRVPFDRSALGWVRTRRIAWIEEDIAESGEEFEENELLLRDGMHSRLIIPLFGGEQVLGTLNFHCRRKGAYSLSSVEGLGTIPDQLALAIQKHRTYVRLKNSEERHRLLFENGPPAAIFVPDGRFVDVNDGCLKLTGYSREEFLGKRNSDLNFDPEFAAPAGTVPSGGNGIEKNASIRRKDGSYFQGHVNIFPVSRNLMLAQITDVTEHRELENRLRHAQKMEAVGTLAGGIAHDFNNIIQAVMGFTSLLKDRISGDPEATAHAGAIEQASFRAAELTSQLLGFARKGKYEVKPTDLNGVAERVVAMIRPAFDRSIEIRTELSAGLFPVDGAQGQLEHSLLNLCINARDAMPEGGTLRIETRNEVHSGQEMYGPVKVPAGLYVALSVSDTGTGIPADRLPRIFEPFFTTKAPGKGTGLGLAMVYGIVKNHGGWIDVRSGEGSGTTFRILLPASPEATAAPPPPLQPETLAGGSESILFVDDEESLRILAKEMLGGLGYDVGTAANGVEALSIYSSNPGRYSLVILDLVMPEMGGAETFQRIREIDPEAKIVISSGYAVEEKSESLLAAGAAGFVQKPYRLAVLAAAVRNALDGKKS